MKFACCVLGCKSNGELYRGLPLCANHTLKRKLLGDHAFELSYTLVVGVVGRRRRAYPDSIAAAVKSVKEVCSGRT